MLLFKFKNAILMCLAISFHQKDEAKYCIEGIRWSGLDDIELTNNFKKTNNLPNKFWYAPLTERNLFQIRRLKGENVYSIYDEPDKEYINVPNSWVHQNEMTNHIIQRKRVILASQARTGKTKAVLEACKYLNNLVNNNLDIWFVTRKGAINGIKREIIKWKFKDIHPQLLTYDGFKKNVLLIKKDLIKLPNILIFDECHALKNYSGKNGKASQQAKDAVYISHLMIKTNGYIILMSGTPSPKVPSDWWSLTEITCPGFFSAKNKIFFAKELGDWKDEINAMGQTYPQLIGWKKEKVKKLYKRMTGLTMVKLKKDCLDLPDIIYDIAKIKATPEQIEASHLIKALPNKNKGALLRLALRQIADGFMTKKIPQEDGSFKTKYTYFSCAKDSLLKEHLKEFSEIGRLVIYCGFTATVEKVIKICVEEGWSVLRIDGKAIKTFNCPYSVNICEEEMDRSLNQYRIEKLVVVAQMDAAGVGREFSAAPVQIAYSSGEKSDSKEQAENRFHSVNMDKVRGATWIDYECMPIDKLIHEALEMKVNIQQVTMGNMEKEMNIYWSKNND
ncbi:MAG: hypothetical protein ACTSXT_13635 [Candidatus Helarchaeota archaeon]